MHIDTVCQKCGAIGYAEVLIFCSICKKNAEHEYCSFNYPNDDVVWSCEDCLPLCPEDNLRLVSCETSQNIFETTSNNSAASADIEILNDMINPIEISSSSDDSIDTSPESSVKDDALSQSDTSDFLLHNHSKSPNAKTNTKKRIMETTSDCESFDKEEMMKRQCICDKSSDETNELLDNEIPGGQDQTKIGVYDQSFKHTNISDHVLILQPKVLSHQAPKNVPALPIVNSCWSGHFVFHDETTKFSISAHLSSKASQRVYNEVQKLPSKICFKKKLKFSTWPKSFLRSPPTDDNIGLFFFPSSVSDCCLYEQTLNDLIAKDLVLIVILEESELLVFPSTELPEFFRRFQSKLYFWGVFRRKQSLISHTPSNLNIKETIKRDQLTIGKHFKQIDRGVAFSNDVQSLSNRGVSNLTNPEKFWKTIFSSQKKYGDDMFASILRGRTDSVRFALDVLSFVFPTSRYDHAKIRNFEWVCLGILKSLVVSVVKDELLILNTRKEARKMVNEWKNMHHKQIFQSNNNAPPYAHTFLLLIVTFGIVIPEERSIYKKLIMCLVKKKNVLELVSSLGLDREVQIDIIKKFIHFHEMASALACIHQFRLMDKFPPIPLLKAYLEKSWNKFCDLIAVVKYVYLFKLEEQFKVCNIVCQIDRLKRVENIDALMKRTEVRSTLKRTEDRSTLKRTEIQGTVMNRTEIQGTVMNRTEIQGTVMNRTEIQGNVMNRTEIQGNVMKTTEQENNRASVPSSSQIGNSLKPLKSLKKKISKDLKRNYKDAFLPSCMQVQPKPFPIPLSSPSAVAETPESPPHNLSSLAPQPSAVSLLEKAAQPSHSVTSSLEKSVQFPHSATSLLVTKSQSSSPLVSLTKATPSSLKRSLQPLDLSLVKSQKSSPPPRPTLSSPETLGSSTLGKRPYSPIPPEKSPPLGQPPSTLENQLMHSPLSSSLEKGTKFPPPGKPSTLVKQPQPSLLSSSLGKRKQSPPLEVRPSFVKSTHHSLSSVNPSCHRRTYLGEASLPLHSNQQTTVSRPLQCRSLHREIPCSMPPQRPLYAQQSTVRLTPQPPPHLYPTSSVRHFPPKLSQQFLFEVPLLPQPPPPRRNFWLKF